MYIKKNIYIIVILVLVVFSANAQVKYSNEFLSLGIGSRALSMGNANVASVNDVTSTFWNPVGLLDIKGDIQIGVMHSSYSYGLAKHDYAAAAFELSDSAVIAFSIIRFGVDDIPNTLDLIDENNQIDYSAITAFSVADYAFMTSFAKKTKIKGLSFGGNLKIVRRVVGEFASAWGFGLDFSSKYKYKSWTFAALARDITGTFNAWKFNEETYSDIFIETGNELPENGLEYTIPKLIFAVNKEFKISESFIASAEADIDLTLDGKRNTIIKTNLGSIDPHAGIEVGYKKMVFLRAGISNIQDLPVSSTETSLSVDPAIGAGLKLKNLYIDYAMANIGSIIQSHVFTLKLDLNKKYTSKI